MSSEAGTRRGFLRQIARETLDTLKHGSYTFNEVLHDLEPRIQSSKEGTAYYAPDSMLSAWASNLPVKAPESTPLTEISILEISTLQGARYLASTPDHGRLGILNFASAKKPGGGFINGAQAQEESLARSSTLYPTLMTATGQKFYTLHNRDPKDGYYSHAMIYSPGVVFFRDDDGGWTEPMEADVLVSPAVNAGVARRAGGRDGGIEEAMRERMARILFLFERKGVKDVVLGSYGTGVFRNDVDLVARIWSDLLVGGEARFQHTFERVVFAILGTSTYETFKDVLGQRMKEDSSPTG